MNKSLSSYLSVQQDSWQTRQGDDDEIHSRFAFTNSPIVIGLVVGRHSPPRVKEPYCMWSWNWRHDAFAPTESIAQYQEASLT